MTPCQPAKHDSRLTIGAKKKAVHPAGPSSVELVIEQFVMPFAESAPQYCIRTWIDGRIDVVHVKIEIADLLVARTKPQVDRPRGLVYLILAQKAVMKVHRPAEIRDIRGERRREVPKVLQIVGVLLPRIYIIQQLPRPKSAREESHLVTLARRCLTDRA